MSENTRKFAVDYARLDSKVIAEDDNSLTMEAVIAREIVHKYDDGMAYKPADELEQAAWTAEGRHVTILEHPATGLLQRREDVHGKILNAHFVRDLHDPKTSRPCGRGIKATIKWDKRKVPDHVVGDIKKGSLRDVSIGFTYDEDHTSGEWNGQKYDYVQRNIFIDHVVAPCELGRCPSPYCGIAVDSIIKNAARKIAGDPWEEAEEYIRSGHREASNECRTMTLSEDEGIKAVVCKYGDKWEISSYLFSKAKEWTMEKAKAWFTKHKGDTADYLVNLYKCHTCRDADRLEGNIDWVRSMENARKLGYEMDAVLVPKVAVDTESEEEPQTTLKPASEQPTTPAEPAEQPKTDATLEQVIAKTEELIALHNELKRSKQ